MMRLIVLAHLPSLFRMFYSHFSTPYALFLVSHKKHIAPIHHSTLFLLSLQSAESHAPQVPLTHPLSFFS